MSAFSIFLRVYTLALLGRLRMGIRMILEFGAKRAHNRIRKTVAVLVPSCILTLPEKSIWLMIAMIDGVIWFCICCVKATIQTKAFQIHNHFEEHVPKTNIVKRQNVPIRGLEPRLRTWEARVITTYTISDLVIFWLKVLFINCKHLLYFWLLFSLP